MDTGYRNEVMREDAKVDKQNSFECYQKWMDIRTGDINFVLDYILEEAGNDNTDNVYRLVDPERIGVMGHSLGGAAALGLGRSRDDVSAVIALESPFLCDVTGVMGDEFVFVDEKYPKPVLNVYSDSIWSLLSLRAQYAENNAMLSDTDPDTFSVYISGTGHLALTDLALTTPILTSFLDGNIKERNARDVLKIINDITLEFFDCYLKEEGNFSSEGTFE
jgi:pimeloyl-ACP methyl ester carboxylesterase